MEDRPRPETTAEVREIRRSAPEITEDEVEEAVPPQPTGHSRTAPAATAAVAAPSSAPVRKRSLKRPLLFILLPVALIAGGYYYVNGGQIMSTDNAYIQAQSLAVSTDVSGTVAEIDVHNNQQVKKGDVLFKLKQDSFQIALAGARAQLGTVRDQVQTLKASYAQAQAEIAQAEADIPYYQASFKRQQDLLASSAVSRAAFDTAQHDLTGARQKVAVAQAQAQAVLAQLGGNPDQPVEQNPFFLQAQSAVDNAQRDLNDTIVRASFDGVATNVDALQVGKYLPASQAAFSLISETNLWIEASPKETELTYVRPGQKATITVDTYPGVEWTGVVSSISPASGSSFSLLPAQNTTGNWVKVVQRIPMRVSIADMSGKPPLRVGMSVVVEVDTGHRRGLPHFLARFFGGSDEQQNRG
ncbi:HlyD family secretion protein [Faunimonas pinastri]|uniref:HlyD family secretion protein n=1 Tax=Faunimonas pinastri TaxID=1855383 RepID=UPI003D1695B8